MRRPAQHHLGPTAHTAWAHPYTGALAAAVFYNDGGPAAPAPAAPAVPSPADLAARAGQQPAPAAAPAPVLPPAGDPDDEKVTLTQRRLNVIMRDEKDEGRRAAYRTIAEATGLDPETFDPEKFADLFKQADDARKAALSDEQRRAEELTTREQAIQAREDAAAQREADAARRDRDSRIRAALVSLGSTGDDLEDAARLISVADDADDTAIGDAAGKLKERRGELFGSAPAPQTLPPAPSGAPAGGNQPRQPVAAKDALREAARKRAEAMGLRPTG